MNNANASVITGHYYQSRIQLKKLSNYQKDHSSCSSIRHGENTRSKSAIEEEDVLTEKTASFNDKAGLAEHMQTST